KNSRGPRQGSGRRDRPSRAARAAAGTNAPPTQRRVYEPPNRRSRGKKPLRGASGAPDVHLRLTVAYDGTGSRGWARQPGERTVEDELRAGLAAVYRGV